MLVYWDHPSLLLLKCRFMCFLGECYSCCFACSSCQLMLIFTVLLILMFVLRSWFLSKFIADELWNFSDCLCDWTCSNLNQVLLLLLHFGCSCIRKNISGIMRVVFLRCIYGILIMVLLVQFSSRKRVIRPPRSKDVGTRYTWLKCRLVPVLAKRCSQMAVFEW